MICWYIHSYEPWNTPNEALWMPSSSWELRLSCSSVEWVFSIENCWIHLGPGVHVKALQHMTHSVSFWIIMRKAVNSSSGTVRKNSHRLAVRRLIDSSSKIWENHPYEIVLSLDSWDRRLACNLTCHRSLSRSYLRYLCWLRKIPPCDW